jgi:hypothetical protein
MIKLFSKKIKTQNVLPVFLIAFLAINGCGNQQCNGGRGELIKCYSTQGDRVGTDGRTGFISQHCSVVDAPPCTCYDTDGTTSLLSKFTKPCDPSLPSQGAKIDAPYVFDYQDKQGVKLYTEFDTYYYDNNTKRNYGAYDSYDETSRPIYVRFKLSDFSLSKNDYKFEIRDGQNIVIHTQTISGQSPSADVVRYLDPVQCSQDECETVGVVQLDLKFARMPGAHKIILSKMAHNDTNKTVVEITQTTFEVKREDLENGYSSSRVLKFVVFKNGPRDLSSYFMAGRSISGDATIGLNLLAYVFGDAKSNMRFTSATRDIAQPYIDNEGDVMLRGNLFSPTRDIIENIDFALNEWVKAVYNNIEYTDPQYRGFAVEAKFMKKYNFSTSPPLIDVTFAVQAPFAVGFLGVTYKNPRTESFYNGLVVMRSKIDEQTTGYSTEFKYTLNDMSMRVFMHELGHLWSASASTSNGCDGHSDKSNGRNYHACLFHNVCVPGTSKEEWDTQAIKDPKYCEGHQQYFMNRLTTR